MRIRVKYCGITRVEDAQRAAHLGVDAIGLVFYPKSARHVSIEKAKEIRQALPPFVSLVALFVNAEPDTVESVIAEISPDYLQFHGDETEDDCKAFSYPYIKALRVGENFKGAEEVAKFPSAEAILFDAKVEGFFGGTGQTFDWKKFGQHHKGSEEKGSEEKGSEEKGSEEKRKGGEGIVEKPDHQIHILAGGLNPKNIAQAIQACNPKMVDVSGGIELAPGIKDRDEMTEFMRVVLTQEFVC